MITWKEHVEVQETFHGGKSAGDQSCKNKERRIKESIRTLLSKEL